MKMSAFLFVAANCISISVRANEAPVAPQPDLPLRVQIKNVPPRLMAWWLDPAHNLGPTKTESLEEFLQRPLTPIAGEKAASKEQETVKGAFALPDGVEKIVTAETGKAIAVYGTSDGVRQLQPIIDFLDKPLRYVEVEAQLVRIDSPEEIGVNLDPNLTPGFFSVGYVRSKHDSILVKLEAEKKAKVLSESSVVGVNGFPMYFGLDVPPLEGADKAKQLPGLSFQVVPTINNDNTVTVLVEGRPSPPTKTAETPRKELKVRTIFNGRNGDAMALFGFDAREFLSEKEAASSHVILLLTPRVLHVVIN